MSDFLSSLIVLVQFFLFIRDEIFIFLFYFLLVVLVCFCGPHVVFWVFFCYLC